MFILNLIFARNYEHNTNTFRFLKRLIFCRVSLVADTNLPVLLLTLFILTLSDDKLQLQLIGIDLLKDLKLCYTCRQSPFESKIESKSTCNDTSIYHISLQVDFDKWIIVEFTLVYALVIIKNLFRFRFLSTSFKFKDKTCTANSLYQN